MKRKLGLIVAAVSLAASLSVFSACDEGNFDVEYSVEVSDEKLVVFTAPEVPDNMSVKDYLDGLVENGLITMEGSESQYGYYITSVNGTKAETTYNEDGSSNGWAWSLYTDFTEEDDVIYATDYKTYSYGETVLYYASYGVSYLPCVEGYTYALVYEGWSYNY